MMGMDAVKKAAHAVGAHRISTNPSDRHVRVEFDGQVLAESDRAIGLHETGLPTRYYLPREDVRMELLTPTDTTSHCPFKGDASYFSAPGAPTPSGSTRAVRGGRQADRRPARTLARPRRGDRRLRSRRARRAGSVARPALTGRGRRAAAARRPRPCPRGPGGPWCRGGSVSAASGRSSKPATATSSGTLQPELGGGEQDAARELVGHGQDRGRPRLEREQRARARAAVGDRVARGLVQRRAGEALLAQRAVVAREPPARHGERHALAAQRVGEAPDVVRRQAIREQADVAGARGRARARRRRTHRPRRRSRAWPNRARAACRPSTAGSRRSAIASSAGCPSGSEYTITPSTTLLRTAASAGSNDGGTGSSVSATSARSPAVATPCRKSTAPGRRTRTRAPR